MGASTWILSSEMKPTMLPTPQRFDVIIAAGNRRASRAVLGTNKILLPVAGAPVITHVLSAVERARCTDRIFVVGDTAQLEEALASPHSPFQGKRPLHLLEQYHTFYENVWEGFLHTLPDYAPETGWQVYLDRPEADKAALFLSADIPLATPQEIETFVAACDLTRYDYFMGVTAESVLRAYYPHGGRPGIKMAYFNLRDLRVRQNNLHLVRPFRLGNRFYIEKMYEARYQREWRNILKLCWELVGKRFMAIRWRVPVPARGAAAVPLRAAGFQAYPAFLPGTAGRVQPAVATSGHPLYHCDHPIRRLHAGPRQRRALCRPVRQFHGVAESPGGAGAATEGRSVRCCPGLTLGDVLGLTVP